MVTSQRPRTGERHVTPLESTRRGAHRARPGALAAALPVLAVAVVVVIAAFAMFQIFGDNSAPADDPKNVAQAGPSTSGSAPQPSGRPSQTQSASPSAPAQSAAPSVDTKARLNVLNNTSVTGLGRRTANKLKEAGWTVKKVGNLTPRNQISTTTVYFATADQQATAEAVVDALGLGEVSQSDTLAANGITVVVAGDFSG